MFNPQAFTTEQLQELAAQPGVTVLNPTHDLEYQPWVSSKVEVCISKLAVITLETNDIQEARRRALEDDELVEFSLTYEHFFKMMTTPSFVKDERARNAISHLIETKRDIEAGVVSATRAGEEVVKMALQSVIGDTQQ